MSQTKADSDPLHPSEQEALASWSRLVRKNQEQAERFREAPEKPDFYSPTADIFKADPHRTGEPVLEILRGMVNAGESWMDIGAGGGRNALPLALLAREVIAVEPSQAMVRNLRQSAAQSGISNLRIVESRWPMPEPPQADVPLISHVGYDIEEIGPFLDAMETSARRLCVAVLLDRAPSTPANQYWPPIHGEPRAPLPALREFLVLQIARGRLCEVRLSTRNSQSFPGPGMGLPFLRQQLFIEPGGKKDLLLQQILAEQEGRISPGGMSSVTGIVSWAPR
jgi:SAM-dependent methyltransferase